MELTEKQREVLQFIQRYFANQGIIPSVREIAIALGKSAQAIQQHIESLRAKGYLQHQPSKSRANVPVQSTIFTSEQINQVPILAECKQDYRYWQKKIWKARCRYLANGPKMTWYSSCGSKETA